MQPTLEKITEIHVAIASPIELGSGEDGRRRFIPITGGHAEGRLAGEVLPHGGDWQTLKPDGSAVLQARYFLRLANGEHVEVDNVGHRHGPEAVMQRLNRGEAVDPADYYFVTQPRLSTQSLEYAWLNRTLFTAKAERYQDRVVVHIYAIR